MNKNMGKEATEKITGFSGVITGYSEYLYGCAQYCITPQKLTSDGARIAGQWFDEGRVDISKASKKKVDPKTVKAKKNGGPVSGRI